MNSEKKKVFKKKSFLPTYPNFFSACNLNHTYSFIWPYHYHQGCCDFRVFHSLYTAENYFWLSDTTEQPSVILTRYDQIKQGDKKTLAKFQQELSELKRLMN